MNRRVIFKFFIGFLVGFILPKNRDNCTNFDSKTGFIFIAMLSTDDNIYTRAFGAKKTWARKLSSRIRFEIFANSTKSVPDTDIIQLKNVSDYVYPPQKKSFTMLKYLSDNYLDNFEWFIRLDDDAYVNLEKLELLLRSIDSREPIYMGSPGEGLHSDDFVPDEFTNFYCMGGTGVIISRAALKLVAPRLKECIKNLYSEHEDLELGRCFYKAGISCTQAFETRRSLFFQAYEKDGSRASSLSGVSFKNLKQAITLHPNKDVVQNYLTHDKILHIQCGLF